jgi:hypothetical protein
MALATRNPAERTPAMALQLSDLPTIGSLWQHFKTGNKYTVVSWLNTSVAATDKYPWMISYISAETGSLWARRADDWHRSFGLLYAPRRRTDPRNSDTITPDWLL